MPQLCLEFIRQPIPGFEGYSIDPHGNIYGKKSQPLATFSSNGYRKITLNGKNHYVHLLVLRTFHGERPPNCEARHKNGNRLDNRKDNLCWGTKKQNGRDRVKHWNGRTNRISAERRELGRIRYEAGESLETIAIAVGCDVRQLRRYVHKYNWNRKC